MNLKPILLTVLGGFTCLSAIAEDQTFSFSGKNLITAYDARYQDYDPILEADIDHDGAVESFFVFDGGSKGAELYFVKGKNRHYAGETYPIKLGYGTPEQYDYQITLHDFDGDKIPEVVFDYTLRGQDGDCEVIVFRLHGVGADPQHCDGLKNWLEPVGNFRAFWGVYHLNGNEVMYKASSRDWETKIFYNGRLCSLKPD